MKIRSILTEIMSYGAAEISAMGKNDIHELIQRRMVTPCNELKPFGGTFYDDCKIIDNHKYVCMDQLIADLNQKEVWILIF